MRITLSVIITLATLAMVVGVSTPPEAPPTSSRTSVRRSKTKGNQRDGSVERLRTHRKCTSTRFRRRTLVLTYKLVVQNGVGRLTLPDRGLVEIPYGFPAIRHKRAPGRVAGGWSDWSSWC